ncbi:AI-2E family transporter, partial [Gammaproteobacteria bacterium]|nr:AI-2E family transporter [Gammaproteobacteria bacterium]
MNTQTTDAQKWLILTVLIIFGYLLYLLAPILTPFLISVFLAYLGDPAVDKLETIKLSRTMSVVSVFCLMSVTGICFLLIVFPLIEEQIKHLFIRIPEMIDWIQTGFLPWISKRFGLDVNSIDLNQLERISLGQWQTFGSFGTKFFTEVSASGQLILLWFSYVLLIPVVTFYLLRDWDLLVGMIRKLIPRQYEIVVTHLTKDCDAVLAEFFRGQLSVMLAQGIFYSLGL